MNTKTTFLSAVTERNLLEIQRCFVVAFLLRLRFQAYACTLNKETAISTETLVNLCLYMVLHHRW